MTAASDSFSKKSVPLDMEKWRPLVLGWEQSEESQKTYCEPTPKHQSLARAEASVLKNNEFFPHLPFGFNFY